MAPTRPGASSSLIRSATSAKLKKWVSARSPLHGVSMSQNVWQKEVLSGSSILRNFFQKQSRIILSAYDILYFDMSRSFILGINGSPHKDGTVAELLDMVLVSAAADGAETKTVNLYDLHMIPTEGNYSENPALETVENAQKDDVTALYPEILRADGLVLATPVYWANMSAVMKNFIEHLTPLENDGFLLQGKIGAVIAASKENEGGVEMAATSVVVALIEMGLLFPPNSVMWYPA